MKLVEDLVRWRSTGLAMMKLRVLLPDNELVKYLWRLAVVDTFAFPNNINCLVFVVGTGRTLVRTHIVVITLG